MTFYALIVSFILQVVAAFLAISLTKVTRYNISWILISMALILMAVRQLFEVLPYIFPNYTRDFTMLSMWFGIITSILATIGIIFVKKIFKSLSEAERIRKVSEMRVLNAIIQTEERERGRFAKDLHDGLGPILSTVKMSLTALQRNPHAEKDDKIIRNMNDLIEEAIGSLKEISDNISPHVLKNFGLEAMMRSFINKVNSTGKINVRFTSNLNKERLQPEVELILYRTVSELINNTIRHAEASNITLNFLRTEELLVIHYQDDGKGFDSQLVEKDPGSRSGIYNIQSRVNSIRGKFTFRSIQGNGMEAEIVIKPKEIR
jgi:signal transduction histidine kinase